MADQWKTDFSIEDDGFAYAAVSHNGEVTRHRLGPGNDVVAAAMGWVEYDDWRKPFTEATLADIADFFEYERERPDIASEIRSVIDEIYNSEEDFDPHSRRNAKAMIDFFSQRPDDAKQD